MGYNERLQYNTQAVAGDFDSDAAGTVAGGASVLMSKVRHGTLSMLVTVDAETENLTITPLWQVSNDNSTWVTLKPQNNAAPVILATGTSGADAAVTAAIEAPQGVYGWRYARGAVQNGVATGASADTYAIGYCYQLDEYA